jgi:hypothetical protein
VAVAFAVMEKRRSGGEFDGLVGAVMADPIISLNHMAPGAGINLRILLAGAGVGWECVVESGATAISAILFGRSSISMTSAFRAEKG